MSGGKRFSDIEKMALERGLPSSVDAERFILGSVLLDASRFIEIAGLIGQEDFALEKHRRIYMRMFELHERGEKIDRITVAEELMRHNELESVDGLGYLVSLDDGMPHIANLESYIKIVRDKATLRRIIHTSQHLMNRALMAEESPDEILAGASEALMGISDTRQVGDDGLMSAGDFLRGFPGGFQSFVEPCRRENGLRTWLLKFDEMTGGFRPGELIVLGARPGQGKSAMSLTMAWNIASRTNTPVGIFSLEMSRELLLLRLLCGVAHVDSQRLRHGYLNAGEREKLRAAANQIAEAPLYIDDSSSLTVMDFHAKVKRFEQKTKQKLGLAIVDYLQLMAGKGENRNQEVGRISRGLKMLAGPKQLNMPILALAQVGREAEKRVGDMRPRLTDLRESGSIENDADMVAFIFREHAYKPDREDLDGLAELIISKARSGPTGKIDLCWLASQQRFENRAEDLGDIPPDGQPAWSQHAE